nr:MAG TPA: hypothetical protein [Caudoviricetes sp.]
MHYREQSRNLLVLYGIPHNEAVVLCSKVLPPLSPRDKA